MFDTFHRRCLEAAILTLKALNYSRAELEKRRKIIHSQVSGPEDIKQGGAAMLMCWTNAKIQQWLKNLSFGNYTSNLTDSGVHGGLFVFDEKFTAKELCLVLKIPNSDSKVS